MILTGQADLQSTIAAVNEGHIFRFLCKPCPPEQLGAAIDDGLKQHRLVTAEKVLLEQTLGGAIKLLIEILGMVRPAAFSRTARLQRYVDDLAADLGLRPAWQWGVAAMTSQLGFLALPEEVLAKVEAAQSLRDDERRLYESHPEIAQKLLTGIPRLEEVAVIVAGQLTPVCITGDAETEPMGYTYGWAAASTCRCRVRQTGFEWSGPKHNDSTARVKAIGLSPGALQSAQDAGSGEAGLCHPGAAPAGSRSRNDSRSGFVESEGHALGTGRPGDNSGTYYQAF